VDCLGQKNLMANKVRPFLLKPSGDAVSNEDFLAIRKEKADSIMARENLFSHKQAEYTVAI